VSAHLLAVTPTAHYLEYVDWAEKVVQEPLQIVNGEAVITDRPGSGIVWDKSAVEKYRV
jgi:mandelate racemase